MHCESAKLQKFRDSLGDDMRSINYKALAGLAVETQSHRNCKVSLARTYNKHPPSAAVLFLVRVDITHFPDTSVLVISRKCPPHTKGSVPRGIQ